MILRYIIIAQKKWAQNWNSLRIFFCQNEEEKLWVPHSWRLFDQQHITKLGTIKSAKSAVLFGGVLVYEWAMELFQDWIKSNSRIIIQQFLFLKLFFPFLEHCTIRKAMTQSNIISCFAWFMEDRSQRWSLHNDLGSGSSNHHHHRPHGVKELWFWLLENMRKNGLSLIILWNWGTNNHNIQRNGLLLLHNDKLLSIQSS